MNRRTVEAGTITQVAMVERTGVPLSAHVAVIDTLATLRRFGSEPELVSLKSGGVWHFPEDNSKILQYQSVQTEADKQGKYECELHT